MKHLNEHIICELRSSKAKVANTIEKPAKTVLLKNLERYEIIWRISPSELKECMEGTDKWEHYAFEITDVEKHNYKTSYDAYTNKNESVKKEYVDNILFYLKDTYESSVYGDCEWIYYTKGKEILASNRQQLEYIYYTYLK